MIKQLCFSLIEISLHKIFFCDCAFSNARQRLTGKVLCFLINEIYSLSIYLIINNNYIHILSCWEGNVDCFIKIPISVLIKLHKHHKLILLMQSKDLVITGDIKVIQHLILLIDLVELDYIEWLSHYIGDIMAHRIGMSINKGISFFAKIYKYYPQYISQIITEEWHLSPSSNELDWFYKKVNIIKHQVKDLNKRLAQLEDKI
ncbi:Ubiquinone biosynthesis protein UbiJ [Candidatus Profftia lariciata]|uniref:ubiquinone biosynthesis accessory factor UbiJ n=1 Tax=Candidatus Profftia lariciata TaxID=1987921 RepID=UPI001D01B52A|nr:SCP2 sterol-binding domain-containing protein [Candidatus Profftia lariciata]UDG81793.1 Ubiquinone biosynthesis protein UbiJ [Candidatus Profftia lariciata]